MLANSTDYKTRGRKIRIQTKRSMFQEFGRDSRLVSVERIDFQNLAVKRNEHGLELVQMYRLDEDPHDSEWWL